MSYSRQAESAGQRSEKDAALLRKSHLLAIQKLAAEYKTIWCESFCKQDPLTKQDGIREKLKTQNETNITDGDFDNEYAQAYQIKNNKDDYYQTLKEYKDSLKVFADSLNEIPNKIDEIVKKATDDLNKRHETHFSNAYDVIGNMAIDALNTLKTSFPGEKNNKLGELEKIKTKFNNTLDLMSKKNEIIAANQPQAMANDDDGVPPIHFASKPPGFFKRHWGKLLVGGLLFAAGAVSFALTFGIPHLIAATGITLTIAAKAAIAAGTGVVGAGLGATAAAGTAKMLGGRLEQEAADLNRKYHQQQANKRPAATTSSVGGTHAFVAGAMPVQAPDNLNNTDTGSTQDPATAESDDERSIPDMEDYMEKQGNNLNPQQPEPTNAGDISPIMSRRQPRPGE